MSKIVTLKKRFSPKEVNKCITLRRRFTWSTEKEQIAYWKAKHDDDPIEKAKIVLAKDFKKFAKNNFKNEWNIWMNDYSGYYIGFASKEDAVKFIEYLPMG